jgi:hypothetical protein
MLFPEKCFNFGEKYHICGNFLGKTVVCPEKFCDPQNGTLTEIFLATGGGEGSHPKKIFLSALFFRKVPLRAWPPQLFEASYAPVSYYLRAGYMMEGGMIFDVFE